MATNLVIDGYALTIVELNRADGGKQPAVTLSFITRSDPDSPEAHHWPPLLLRPRDIQELIDRLEAMRVRLESKDYSGPGQAH